MPIVHRPDRRDLIGYLEGNIAKKDLKSLDLSAPLQMPTNFKRTATQAKLNKIQVFMVSRILCMYFMT